MKLDELIVKFIRRGKCKRMTKLKNNINKHKYELVLPGDIKYYKAIVIKTGMKKFFLILNGHEFKINK